MKRPADQGGQNGGDDGRVAQHGLTSGSSCPWPCLYTRQHTELVDPTGRVQATVCRLCGQFVSRADWQALVYGYDSDEGAWQA